METDSSDEDSAHSIPRPSYEAISAIESPQPMSMSTSNEVEQFPSKRQKYMVSAPPTNVNGASSGDSSTSTTTAAAGSGHSLTMKLTKVSRGTSDQATELKTGHSSTPKHEGKVRVHKEMIALMKSHDESKVLKGYVGEGSTLKRRKSRSVAMHKIEEALSQSLPASHRHDKDRNGHRKKSLKRGALKRSKSIPASGWESDEEWRHESNSLQPSKRKAQKKRGHSVTYDVSEYRDSAELSPYDSSSNQAISATRFRSRSKTISLGNEDRVPRRTNLRTENKEFARKHSAFLDRIINDPVDEALDMQAAQEPDVENVVEDMASGEWLASPITDTEPSISTPSDASALPTRSTHSSQILNGIEEVEQRLNELWQPPPRDGWDPFCWKCRECGKLVPCSKCLRSFHSFCVRPASSKFDGTWKCPECMLIEGAPKRSRRNDVSVDLLSQLLNYALERMKHVRGVYKLRAPDEVLPQSYKKYFVNPVNFASLAERIRNRAFHSADEFLSEVKWMQHNALILDAGDIKVEQASKAVVKVCRQEANEIDTCAECYLNANSSDEWFVKVCTHPHLLLWAKLKGFPYWPAKAMSFGPNSLVNVRFFGKHDRANVPIKDCFLYSAQDPNTQTSRRSARDLAECIKEVEVHIEQIKSKIGSFNYAPYRTPYDPLEEDQQLDQMMPGVHECIKRQLMPANKTPLQFLIRKTAGDKLSIVKKTKAIESGNESDHSASPSKLSKQADLPEPVKEHIKPHSSNYEVIPKLADPLSESRGCTVILKRKSLEANKLISKQGTAVRQSPEIAPKRKHSLSDASATSETSQQGEHRRRGKHARKQLELENAMEEVKELSEKRTAAALDPPDPASDVLSVVELVKRRQGVTITKISREQPVAKPNESSTTPKQIESAPPADNSSAIAGAATKQLDLERQQQQLISKVVPFVEIKTEVLSEPEDTEEAPQPAPNTSPHLTNVNEEKVDEVAPTSTAISTTSALSNTAQRSDAANTTTTPAAPSKGLLMNIKEEIISDDEVQVENCNKQPEPVDDPPVAPLPLQPPPQPVALPSRSDVMITATEAHDSFVRFVSDTTIKRISNKEAADTANKSLEVSSSKRNSLRGVVHGPLPAAAQSLISPLPSALSPSPPNKQTMVGTNNTPLNRSPSQALPPTNTNAQASAISHFLNNDTLMSPVPSSSPASLLPPCTSSNLLKSNPSFMTVIPVDAAQSPHLPRNSNGGSTNSSNIPCTSLMTIPVPPLTAVSKNTLQSSNTNVCTNAGPMQSIPQPPPPLVGLTVTPSSTATISTSSADTTTFVTANGVPSETMGMQPASTPSAATADSTAGEFMTQGVGTALSEILLRGGPPKLTARPRGPLQSDGASIYPAQAGPVSQRLKENAHKITDYFISVIEDTLSDLAASEPSLLQARITGLTLENERIKQHYERQLADMQRSTDLMIREMRKTLENENKRVINELRQQSVQERMRAVEETKKKQWCANCMREAQLYCCWNTSYCDYPCQQVHWARHSMSCGQAQQIAESSRSKPKPMSATNINQYHKTIGGATTVVSVAPVGTVAAVVGNKKWQQPLISVVSASNTEVLKIPNTNTYVRAVPSIPPTTVTMSHNSIASSATLIAPTQHHTTTTIMSSQRNALTNYGAKAAPTGPIQRYNIPLPIQVSTNQSQSYGLMSNESTQKQTGRNTAKINNRGRNNNIGNNAQGMRQSQINPVFKQ
ncbi:protein kinase C-binding protein 1 [Scaptodrosophila lebanonensis]|uniref:Protein kinase C-binding protein 1 n=1 Tax=Drosophila lebanonensis TaxID=7225 RepID=A0A6J2SY10_DROLE|nr:protein kinase C-binding protein 1 [Scaptodrosophila lebanonensis]XP_030369467.1 protein kinase C-binding protein 1 [Scaptodrosophila lebanonensis]